MKPEELSSEKVEFIYQNAINYVNQQRTSLDTHRQKATTFLTICIVLSSSIFAVVFPQKVPKGVLIAIGLLLLFLVVSIVVFIGVLRIKKVYCTYSPPIEHLMTRDNYKVTLDTMLMNDVKYLHETVIPAHEDLFAKQAKWLNWGMGFVVFSAFIPVIVVIDHLFFGFLSRF